MEPIDFTEQYKLLKQFGQRVRELRLRDDSTQDTIARRIRMARTYYTEIETGKRNVSLLNIERIADGFGVTIKELFDSPIFDKTGHSDKPEDTPEL